MARIRCSRCGETIPFEGSVCPFCHANKTADKKAFERQVVYKGAFFLGFLIVGIIGLITQSFNCCWGSIIGGIAGVAIIAYLDFLHPRIRPPVRSETDAEPIVINTVCKVCDTAFTAEATRDDELVHCPNCGAGKSTRNI
jgi:RNA polymerase subunit RPABC4/transcription elongation factor Spt4